MPEELIDFIIEAPDSVLKAMLAWIRKNPADAVQELEAVITRQGIK